VASVANTRRAALVLDEWRAWGRIERMGLAYAPAVDALRRWAGGWAQRGAW
jgi:hypothetical protein